MGQYFVSLNLVLSNIQMLISQKHLFFECHQHIICIYIFTIWTKLNYEQMEALGTGGLKIELGDDYWEIG